MVKVIERTKRTIDTTYLVLINCDKLDNSFTYNETCSWYPSCIVILPHFLWLGRHRDEKIWRSEWRQGKITAGRNLKKVLHRDCMWTSMRIYLFVFCLKQCDAPSLQFSVKSSFPARTWWMRDDVLVPLVLGYSSHISTAIPFDEAADYFWFRGTPPSYDTSECNPSRLASWIDVKINQSDQNFCPLSWYVSGVALARLSADRIFLAIGGMASIACHTRWWGEMKVYGYGHDIQTRRSCV